MIVNITDKTTMQFFQITIGIRIDNNMTARRKFYVMPDALNQHHISANNRQMLIIVISSALQK